MADLLSQMEGPTSSGYGNGLYDFGYLPTQQPPAGAASTASQIESGGGGFDWNSALHDITGVWMATQAKTPVQQQLPTGYRLNEQGQLYATDPAYRGSTIGGAVGAIGGIPTAWLLIGGLIFGAVLLSKEA